jgi:hypothetical protein
VSIRAQLKSFSPAGLSDAEDAANAFDGACASLINLIPKPSTRNLWVPRPAQTPITTFSGFTTPGFISALKIIGTRAYGMIASGRNAGKDEPFCYEIEAGTFVTITGITNPNTPTSPATSGDWTPPIIELVGTRLIVTHPGFTGAAGVFFGWFDLSNPAAPVWNGGNTTTTLLPFVPVSVANYQGSAALASGNGVYFTDPLTLNVKPDKVLVTYDNTDVTALKPLGFNTEVAGGVVQALIIFKGLGTAMQLKGTLFSDPSFPQTITAELNNLNYAVGTLSPLALIDTPVGAGVLCPDGIRIIDFDGNFGDPVGSAGDGVNVPFINSLVPSRATAACNAAVVRVTVQNGGIAGTPTQEYWYHINRNPKVWSGPHSFAPSLIEAYKNKFITAPKDVTGALYMSEVFPSTTTTYVENGVQLTWTMATVMFSDYGAQGVYNFNEMTLNIAVDPTMIQWAAYIINPNLVQYDNVNNIIPNTSPIWDAAVWDAAVWDGMSQGLAPRRVEWSKDITTSRAQIVYTGGSAGGVIIGETKYMQGSYQYVPNTGV